MAATAILARQIGALATKGGGGWYGPHMAAASRAIAERLPLVDLVLEIRDARIPLSSEYEQLRNYPSSSRRIIVMNKMDLANRSQIKLLNFLLARVRELKRTNDFNYTAVIMLIGIPNVGKSALANSLHQIGRISAAEKGKLKHAIVSPNPGETKDISSLKIGSHPNVYVLDTPGVLPPKFSTLRSTPRSIRDCLLGEREIAQYFLALLNSSDEYKKWAKLSMNDFIVHDVRRTLFETISSFDGNVQVGEDLSRLIEAQLTALREAFQVPVELGEEAQNKDFIVHDVRRTLFETISSFDGNVQVGEDLSRLIEAELTALREAFQVPVELGEEAQNKVAAKLLNLYLVALEVPLP
ncbi:dar gtpase 2, partial [Quercus suber]